jgi:hypothetical protein
MQLDCQITRLAYADTVAAFITRALDDTEITMPLHLPADALLADMALRLCAAVDRQSYAAVDAAVNEYVPPFTIGVDRLCVAEFTPGVGVTIHTCN